MEAVGIFAACPLAFGEVGVKTRVKSVLHYKKPGFWIIILAVAACGVTALCLLTNPKQEGERVSDLKALTAPWRTEALKGSPDVQNMLQKTDSTEAGSFTAQYVVSEILYNNGSFDLVGDEVNSLQFLIMNGRLMWNDHDLSDENAALLNSWAEIGELQPFRLEKSNFDNLFVNDEIWAEGYTPESIRENTDNTEKAKTEHEWNGQKQFFYILQQQNGILILCRGFYGDDGNPFIRWVYRLEYIGGEMEEPDYKTKPPRFLNIDIPPAELPNARCRMVRCLRRTGIRYGKAGRPLQASHE